MHKRTRRPLAFACCALVLGLSALWAQPKPKSQKEVDALKAIQAAQGADAQIKAIENVLTNFADTEYKVLLLQMAMQIAEQKNDLPQTVFYAERLLEADPKNAFALVTMASEIPRNTREFDLDKEEKLAKAEKYAKAAADAIKDTPKPRPDLTDEQWAAVKKDLTAQTHEALGMSAGLRKKYDAAIAEYKTALEMASNPDPATYVRLAQAYQDTGKLDDASAALDKALSLPNALPQVKQIAQAKKADIAKLKAAGAKP